MALVGINPPIQVISGGIFNSSLPVRLFIPVRLVTTEIARGEIHEGPNLGWQIFPLGKDGIESMVGDAIGLQELNQPPAP